MDRVAYRQTKSISRVVEIVNTHYHIHVLTVYLVLHPGIACLVTHETQPVASVLPASLACYRSQYSFLSPRALPLFHYPSVIIAVLSHSLHTIPYSPLDLTSLYPVHHHPLSCTHRLAPCLAPQTTTPTHNSSPSNLTMLARRFNVATVAIGRDPSRP